MSEGGLFARCSRANGALLTSRGYRPHHEGYFADLIRPVECADGTEQKGSDLPSMAPTVCRPLEMQGVEETIAWAVRELLSFLKQREADGHKTASAVPC